LSETGGFSRGDPRAHRIRGSVSQWIPCVSLHGCAFARPGGRKAQDLDRLFAGAAEPVGHPCIEVGDLSRAEDNAVVSEDEMHAAPFPSGLRPPGGAYLWTANCAPVAIGTVDVDGSSPLCADRLSVPELRQLRCTPRSRRWGR